MCFFISPRLITRKAAAETNSYEQQNASVVRENDSNRVAVNPKCLPTCNLGRVPWNTSLGVEARAVITEHLNYCYDHYVYFSFVKLKKKHKVHAMLHRISERIERKVSII